MLTLFKKENKSSSYETWFQPIKPIDYKNQILILGYLIDAWMDWGTLFKYLNNSILKVQSKEDWICNFKEKRNKNKKTLKKESTIKIKGLII